MTSIINVGTTAGNWQNVEIEKSFNDITANDCAKAIEKETRYKSPKITGWCLIRSIKKVK